MVKIRQNREEELEDIYQLIRTAFQTAAVYDGDEQDFAMRLRKSWRYLPQLELVAEEGGQLVGHVMLTNFIVQQVGEMHPALLLAPLCVRQDYRGQGVGTALIREGFQTARELGFDSVFLIGDPGFYQRFGFRSTADYGIENVNGVAREYALCRELVRGALREVRGRVDFRV